MLFRCTHTLDATVFLMATVYTYKQSLKHWNASLFMQVVPAVFVVLLPNTACISLLFPRVKALNMPALLTCRCYHSIRRTVRLTTRENPLVQ